MHRATSHALAILTVGLIALAGCAGPTASNETPAPVQQAEPSVDGPVTFTTSGTVLVPSPAQCALEMEVTEIEGSVIPWPLDIPANATADVRINMTFAEPQAVDLNLFLMQDGEAIAWSRAINVGETGFETIHAPALEAGEYAFYVVACIGAAAPFTITVEGTWLSDGRDAT